MTQKYNDKKTNEAWDLLYARIEKDGLLAAKEVGKKTFLRSATLKWAASIAVICISAVILSLILTNKSSVGKPLSVHNQADAVTLVTTLEDGSIVYLAKQASIHFPKHFEEDKREVFLEGNALFDVTGNKERPFIIETELIKIEVLGTMFDIKNINAFSLSVQRGEVKVTLKKSGQSALVKSGETVSLYDDQLETTLTPHADDYRNYIKQIQFKDERLADVIRIINRNSEFVKLEIAPQLEDRLLTVTFSDDSPNTMAQLICMALNLKYTQQQNMIRISELKN